MEIKRELSSAKSEDIARLAAWLGFNLNKSICELLELINSSLDCDLDVLLNIGFLQPTRRTKDGKVTEYKLSQAAIQLLQNNIDNDIGEIEE
jgi:hypothetical protein